MSLKQWALGNKRTFLSQLASFWEKVAAGAMLIALFPQVLDFRFLWAIAISCASILLSMYLSAIAEEE